MIIKLSELVNRAKIAPNFITETPKELLLNRDMTFKNLQYLFEAFLQNTTKDCHFITRL